MVQKSLVQACYDDLKKTVELLQETEEVAREFFNAHVYARYAKAINDPASPLSPFFFFLKQLDEYLNNPGYRALNQGSVEDIVGSFNSDFQEEYHEALEKEKSTRN